MTLHRRPRQNEGTPAIGWSSARFALVSAFGAWLLYVSLVAVRVVAFGFPRPVLLMERHVLTALAGMALAGLLYLLLRRLEAASISLRIVTAVFLAAPPAVLLSFIDYNVMFVFAPLELFAGTGIDPHPDAFAEMVYTVVENYFVFAAWTVLYTAFSSAMQTQDALRRAVALEAAARSAELRALRYQLDPHFLFNALNTVSGLVLSGDPAGADRTIDALSSFLRATLALDASEDIRLADEIRLQHFYLQIEKIRFGDRLLVGVSVPDALADAPMPALLLQPLVENSIRHAVARSTSPVRLSVVAWAEADMLHIVVEDDGPGGAGAGGHGVGLGNVASRLALRFGAVARCDHGPLIGGGFRTEITLPYKPVQRRSG